VGVGGSSGISHTRCIWLDLRRDVPHRCGLRELYSEGGGLAARVTPVTALDTLPRRKCVRLSFVDEEGGGVLYRERGTWGRYPSDMEARVCGVSSTMQVKVRVFALRLGRKFERALAGSRYAGVARQWFWLVGGRG